MNLLRENATIYDLRPDILCYHVLLAMISSVAILIRDHIAPDWQAPYRPSNDYEDYLTFIRLLEDKCPLLDGEGNKFVIHIPLVERLRLFRNYVCHTPEKITRIFLSDLRQDIRRLSLLPSPFGEKFTLMNDIMRELLDEEDHDSTLVTLEKTIKEIKELDRSLLPIVGRAIIKSGKAEGKEARFLRYNGSNASFFLINDKSYKMLSNRTLISLTCPKFLFPSN